MKFYTLEEGKKLVKAARNSIELFLSTPNFKYSIIENTLPEFTQRHGVFVTLYVYQTQGLRGCIGFIEGIEPINRLLPQAAISAAAEDPRFNPVSKDELSELIIEVSILSEPTKLSGNPNDLIRQIKIGRDGLIINYGYLSGLLLPIVAVEEKWGPKEFLDNVCIKAGLPSHMWRMPGVSLSRFSTQVFREKEPKGEVEEVKLET